ncbi:unnamed protein product [Closterium sp. NIES-54]
MASITVVAVSRGGQQQPLPHPDTLSLQQLREWIREWIVQRGRPGGGGYGFKGTGQRRQQETFSPQRLRDCVSQRGVPGCVEAASLGGSGSAAALGATESAAALGASASTAIGPTSAEALHTFHLILACLVASFVIAPQSHQSLHQSQSHWLTPLGAPTLHEPPLSSRDVWVDTFIPGGQRVAICTCSRTRRHLATFTWQPGSSPYTLTTACAQLVASGQVAASNQVSASGQLAASCSCRVLSH